MIGFRFSLAPLLALLAFGVSAGVVWLAHEEAGKMTTDRQPPLVKASTAPLKRLPDDPGGRTVADLGGVGDLLSDQPAETEERLLPSPEQPVTPADGNGVDNLDPGAALEALVSEIRTKAPAGAEGTSSDNAAALPSPSRPASVEPVTPRAVAVLDDQAAATVAAQPAEPSLSGVSTAIEATAGGRYRVQLAAVREEADAQRAWAIFQEQLGPLVSGLEPFFERAETSNGIFYRVQVGPFGETAEADRVCFELKKQDTSCFVVTR